jgi:hypothetical protein
LKSFVLFFKIVGKETTEEELENLLESGNEEIFVGGVSH